MQINISKQHTTELRMNPEAAFHHMLTVQVNSLNKQEDNRHIWLLWLTTQLDAQIHQFDCEINFRVGCIIMHQHIYRSLFRDRKPEPPTVFINGYSVFPVQNQGPCTVVLLNLCHAPHISVFQVTDIRGFLILDHKTTQQIGYTHFPALPNSTKADTTNQDMCSHEGHNSKHIKVQGKETSKMGKI